MAAQTQVAVCAISLIAGYVFWHSFSQLFTLVLTPDKIRALPLWLLNLENNASILGAALATVGCFAAIIYFSRKHITFSRKSDK